MDYIYTYKFSALRWMKGCDILHLIALHLKWAFQLRAPVMTAGIASLACFSGIAAKKHAYLLSTVHFNLTHIRVCKCVSVCRYASVLLCVLVLLRFHFLIPKLSLWESLSLKQMSVHLVLSTPLLSPIFTPIPLFYSFLF